MKDIKQIFNERTCNNFSNKPVEHGLLQEIYEIAKLGATSANCSPLRIKFVTSAEQKAKLIKCMAEGNVQKTNSAPVNAIFAYDEKFYTLMPKLFPHNPGMQDYFSSSSEVALDNAKRNAVLQAAYFMIAARGMGLECGPMSGFDVDAVNKEFFSGSSLKVDFICNLGYRAEDEKHPRLPRLAFSEACEII